MKGFKWELNLGHVLQILSMLGAMGMLYVNLDRRVTILETHQQVDSEVMRDLSSTVKQLVVTINRLPAK